MVLLGLASVGLVDAAVPSPPDDSTAIFGDLLHQSSEGDHVDARDSPLVVNTWTGDFSHATARAWEVLSSGDGDVLLDAIEQVHQRLRRRTYSCLGGDILSSLPWSVRGQIMIA